MYLDATFEIEEIRSDYVRVWTWPRFDRLCRLFDTDLDVGEGDIIEMRIENHSPERGWVVDEVRGFPYEDDE